jgi:hypothetical protein
LKKQTSDTSGEVNAVVEMKKREIVKGVEEGVSKVVVRWWSTGMTQ